MYQADNTVSSNTTSSGNYDDTVLNLSPSFQAIYTQSQYVNSLQQDIGTGQSMNVTAMLEMQNASSILTQQMSAISQIIQVFSQASQQAVQAMSK